VLLAESFIERNTTSITVVAAVVLALFTVWFSWYLHQEDRKLRAFDHRVVSDLAILSGHAKPDYIKVMVGILELQDPRMTTVKFKNTGKQVIDESDFREPYVITREAANLLDYSVIEESAPNLVTKLERVDKTDDEPQKLLVYPGMLNRGDEFTLKLFYDGGVDDWPIINGRFRDHSRESAVIPSRDELVAATEGQRTLFPVGLVLAPTGILMLFVAPNERTLAVIFMVIGAISIAGGFTFSFFNKRELYRRTQTVKPKHGI
jgi:hypothetical protein